MRRAYILSQKTRVRVCKTAKRVRGVWCAVNGMLKCLWEERRNVDVRSNVNAEMYGAVKCACV